MFPHASDIAEAAPPAVVAVLDAVISGLEDLERRQRQLDAERIGLLAAAFDIAAAESADRADTSIPRGETGELAYRAMRAEVALTLQVTERTMDRHLSQAFSLTNEYPRTLEALKDGRVSHRHAIAIADAGAVIGGGDDPGTVTRRAAFEEAVLEVAARQTPARLAPIARRIAEEFAETSLEERHRQALKLRGVWVEDCEDGMANLVAHLPATTAHGIYRRLTLTARRLQREHGERPGPRFVAADEGDHDAGEASLPAGTVPGSIGEDAVELPRSRDEIRADLLADLLSDSSFSLESLCAHADDVRENDIRPGVQVQIITTSARLGLDPVVPPRAGASPPRFAIPIPALPLDPAGASPPSPEPLDLDGITHRHHPPAILDGYGPVPDSVAREAAAEAAHWETIAVSEDGTRVLSVDRYRPSEQMRRFLAARDRCCRFPGCRMPAVQCDLDHTIDAAKGGPTHTGNLAHLCRAHHTLKHNSGWCVRQRPGGVMEWRTPTGRIRVDHPDPQPVPA